MTFISRKLLPWTIFLLPFYKYGLLKYEVIFFEMNAYVTFLLPVAFFGLLYLMRGANYRSSKVDLFLVLLCFAFLISFILTRNRGALFLMFHSLFVPAASYFSFKLFVRSREDFHRIMTFYVRGLIILAFAAVYMTMTVGKRTISLGVNPIDLATFFFPALVYYYVTRKWWGIVGIVQASCLAGGFLAAFARGFTLILFAVPVMRVLINKGFQRFLFWCACLGALLFVFSLASTYRSFSSPLAEQQAMQQRGGEESRTADRFTSSYYYKLTLHNRGQHFSEGLRKFRKKPFFGHGLEKGEVFTTWHCSIIEMLVYGGILGYLLYTGFLYVSFARSRLVRVLRDESTFCLLVILSIYANSLMNGIMHGIAPLIVFIFIGMHEAIVRIDQDMQLERGAA